MTIRPRRRSLAVAVVFLATLLAPTGATATPFGSGTSHRIGDSPDVATAAVQISSGDWAAGSARRVVLGRSDVFADTLAGATLAGTDGPVLFTTGGSDAPLLPAVRAEIARGLPEPSGCASGGAEIDVLGGTSAVSTRAADELAALGYCVVRIAGQ